MTSLQCLIENVLNGDDIAWNDIVEQEYHADVRLILLLAAEEHWGEGWDEIMEMSSQVSELRWHSPWYQETADRLAERWPASIREAPFAIAASILGVSQRRYTGPLPRWWKWTRCALLDGYEYECGDRGAIALASNPASRVFEELSLNDNCIGDEGALALVESEHLNRLNELAIGPEMISREVWARLEQRFGEVW